MTENSERNPAIFHRNCLEIQLENADIQRSVSRRAQSPSDRQSSHLRKPPVRRMHKQVSTLSFLPDQLRSFLLFYTASEN